MDATDSTSVPLSEDVLSFGEENEMTSASNDSINDQSSNQENVAINKAVEIIDSNLVSETGGGTDSADINLEEDNSESQSQDNSDLI